MFPRSTLFIAAAIVAFVLAAVGYETDGEVGLLAGTWLAVGLALYAGSRLP